MINIPLYRPPIIHLHINHSNSIVTNGISSRLDPFQLAGFGEPNGILHSSILNYMHSLSNRVIICMMRTLECLSAVFCHALNRIICILIGPVAFPVLFFWKRKDGGRSESRSVKWLIMFYVNGSQWISVFFGIGRIGCIKVDLVRGKKAVCCWYPIY